MHSADWGLCLQVPSGVFVFLNDIDFIPTPTVHQELTSGRWRTELLRMRTAFFDHGKRETVVLPAFERTARGAKAVPYEETCESEQGCKLIDGMALPRTFDMLRTMLQHETVVDVFHRPQVPPPLPCLPAPLPRAAAWPVATRVPALSTHKRTLSAAAAHAAGVVERTEQPLCLSAVHRRTWMLLVAVVASERDSSNHGAHGICSPM